MTTSDTQHDTDADREHLTQECLGALTHWGVIPYRHYDLTRTATQWAGVEYRRIVDEARTVAFKAWAYQHHYLAQVWDITDGTLTIPRWSSTAYSTPQEAIDALWAHLDQEALR